MTARRNAVTFRYLVCRLGLREKKICINKDENIFWAPEDNYNTAFICTRE